ncbi:MAG: hypothetical protein ABI134_08230, partial [Byssovorax sp.]
GPDEENVTPGTYPGAKLLTTTDGWLTGGLQDAPKQDVLACLLAHLNPTAEVEILLSGESVKDQTDVQFNQGEFSFKEAVWAVTVGSAGTTYNVWPLTDLERACHGRAAAKLQTRVCGGFAGPCDVNVRSDLGTACTLSAGYYTCLGQHAILTKLRPTDVSTLHGGCGL